MSKKISMSFSDVIWINHSYLIDISKVLILCLIIVLVNQFMLLLVRIEIYINKLSESYLTVMKHAITSL